MYVTEDGLRLRDAPGLQSNAIAFLSSRTIVELTGPAVDVEGDDWMWQPVEIAGGRRGFVALEYLSAEISAIGWVDRAPLTNDGLYQSGFGFGQEVDQGLHSGLDIWANDQTVRANAEGRVYLYQTWQDEEGWHVEPYDSADPEPNDALNGFGNYAVRETDVDGETYYQVFAHLDSLPDGLAQGEQVAAGTELGTMGQTGFADGVHLHWEARRDEAVQISEHGVHSFSAFYPEDQAGLDQLFVDPDEFAGWLE